MTDPTQIKRCVTCGEPFGAAHPLAAECTRTPDTKQGEGEATPRPWSVHHFNDEFSRITGEHTLFIEVRPCADGFVPGANRANVALIVEAVNSFDALTQRVKVLEEALGKICAIRNGAHPDGAIGKCTDIWRVAIEALAPPVGEKGTPK